MTNTVYRECNRRPQQPKFIPRYYCLTMEPPARAEYAWPGRACFIRTGHGKHYACVGQKQQTVQRPPILHVMCNKCFVTAPAPIHALNLDLKAALACVW